MSMRPARGERPAPAGRRLENGVKRPASKYANGIPNSGRDEAKRLGELEKSRQRLGMLIESYAKLLTDTTLPENRSIQEREDQRNVLDSLPRAAADLDLRNVAEGTQSVLVAVLSSTLVLRDQVNKLKFQNYILNKKVQELKGQIEKGGAPAPEGAAAESKELSNNNGTGE